MKKATNFWRGLLAITLSLTLLLSVMTGVADSWRSAIDGIFGTASIKIETGDKYVSTYKTSNELVAAHKELGERMSEEGSVLLKNENNALPLASNGLKVTLFGMGSLYPFQGGVMGSSATSDRIDLVEGLTEKGFQVNPTMTAIYEAMGSVVTGEKQGWGGSTPIYGYRPAEFSGSLYAPSEPHPDAYTKSSDEMGGGADANYTDSFAQYNDAAIVVFSRPGSEGSDFYPGAEGIDASVYGTDSALSLCANERAVLELAKEHFDTVIVLINTGSAMEIDDLKKDPEVDAIMYIGFPGTYGFLGVADLLKGDANPSGGLSDTYAVDAAMSPAAQNFGNIQVVNPEVITWPDSLMKNVSPDGLAGTFGGSGLGATNYLIEAEGIYVGYKYYESRYYDAVLGQGNASSGKGASNGASSWVYDNEVSYTFGYGLSYTTFEQTLKSVDVDVDVNGKITATVAVKNTGNVAGAANVQLYVNVPYTQYDKDNGIEKSAISFLTSAKTEVLDPNEEVEVELEVLTKYMASWDSSAKDGKGGWILDGGDYVFAVGNGAHEATKNVLAAQGHTSEGGKTSMAVTKTIGTAGSVDETTFAVAANGTEIVNQAENIDINYYKPGYATYLSRTDWDATFPRHYDDLMVDGSNIEWIQSLTNEVYQIKTTDNVDMKGSGGSLTLADLAGVEDIDDIRWQQLVEQIPVGTLIAKIVKGGSTCDVIEEIANPLVYQNDGPNGFSSTLNSRGAVGEDDPNANFAMNTMANNCVLGSTFNPAIVREWGALMGNDGLWSGNYMIWGSAPNYHRSPWNGRNFEYFTEDPMLAAHMGAAIIDGTLEFGIIVGPKHFAFNDQETQRSGVAPYMTEQKARETDLRAFQMAMEDVGALGVMTSFSRIGATTVNGHLGMMQEILRGEWGFKGLVTTDMMNNAAYFRPEMCISAGITMIADFSRNETMEQVVQTWPYFTEECISGDQELVNMARQNMKYQLYAFSQSAIMNIKTTQITPWWETALNTSIYVCAALSVLCLVMYALPLVNKKKEEV